MAGDGLRDANGTIFFRGVDHDALVLAKALSGLAAKRRGGASYHGDMAGRRPVNGASR